MSTTQVRANLFRVITPLLDDAQAMMRITQFVDELNASAAPCQYSVQEAQARVAAATTRIEAGEEFTTNQDFKKEVYSWLQ
ncbi:MAG: hypothetical protein J6T85_03185 [Paludibacteraceae bacterium]|nr:hypothetical protein [Paludibacteraceae bacterium]